MSWGQCYSASNNIHFDSPPIMNDGRIYSSWQPEAIINDKIQKNEKITTNWEYRKYIQQNGLQIMKHNSFSACNDIGINSHEILNTTSSKNTPHLYNSPFDERTPSYGYTTSDLKNPYLSRQQLNAKLIAPSININEYLK